MRVEQLGELRRADIEDGRARRFGDAGAVDQDVDAAELVNAPVHQRLCDLLIRRRTGMGDGTPAGGSDAFRGGVGSVGVSAVDHHTGAVLRQQRRDSRADAP